MAKKSKRISLLIVLIPMLTLLFGSGYLVFSKWQNYSKDKQLSKQVNTIEYLVKLKQSIVDEVTCTAEVSNVVDDVRVVCAEQRNMTDSIVSASNKYESIDLPFMKDLVDSIKNTRYDIDSSRMIDLKMLLNGDYYKKIINPIYKYMQVAYKNSIIADKVEFTRLLRSSSKSLYYGELERVLVSYYLSTSQSIPLNILKDLDNYITSSSVPFADIMALGNKPKIKILRSTEDKLSDARIDFLSSYMTGDYGLNPDAWSRVSAIKMDTLKNMQTSILKEIKVLLNDSIVKQERLIYAGVFLSILGLLFTVYIIIYYVRVREEDVALEKVVTNIEKLSLGKYTSDETPPLPKNLGNKKEVYTYLESILYLLHNKEKEAEDANMAKSLFLANMSHEIRTPLNGIVGFTQLLKDTRLEDDQEEFLSIIENSSKVLLNIINDILDLSKMNADKMELEATSFNIFDIVGSTIEILMAKAEEKDITLGLFIDPNIGYHHMGDPTKIAQVLTNLVGNALKFTPAKGTISISIESPEELSDNDIIRFSVKDTGIGISKEEQSKIFDAFSQADASTSRRFGGTGLGLAISKKMVKLMGGELNVVSKKGEGSTFYFDINLPNDDTASVKKIPSFPLLRVGLTLPMDGVKRDIDYFIERYILSLGVGFRYYEYDELLDVSNLELPDIMIFDHKHYKTDIMMRQILSIDCAHVLITTGALKDSIDLDNMPFETIAYTPITLDKIIRVLDTIVHKTVVASVEDNIEHAISFNNLKILVAEDNLVNQKLIIAVLEKYGIDVTMTTNGEEALKMRQTNDYDAIFMDIQMPIMNGVEATQEILSYEKSTRSRHVPIIALTANALAGDAKKYINQGMDNYLSKPIDIKSLVDLLYHYFPRHAIVDDKYIVNDTQILEEHLDTQKDQPVDEIQSDSTLDIKPDTNSDTEVVQAEEDSKLEKSCVDRLDDELKDIDKFIEKTEKQKHNHIELDNTVLLYMPMPLLLKVFRQQLSSLGYTIEETLDRGIFLDKVKNLTHKYVIYNGDDFYENKYQIAKDIFKGNSRPIMVVSHRAVAVPEYLGVLNFDSSLDEIAQQLERS